MMWEGEVLQMIHEMKRSLSVTDTDEAWKQINYFTNNQDRWTMVTRSRLADRQWLGRRAVKLVVGRRLRDEMATDDNRCCYAPVWLCSTETLFH